ncbi:unnamed protein product [Acanthoscelides obtectus]|uniref:Uncharacterized protein n=1 Tax=Acanthoscelides obtectus TaxID=200917 RepID=A0A9P0PHJ8_ACAOB|nr:unnamed protein product [Acanthoscelides obtectus]CAK1670700.1 hypothetical protein AOBTE_LOCUS27774 [Acanthoscelides obtectus]
MSDDFNRHRLTGLYEINYFAQKQTPQQEHKNQTYSLYCNYEYHRQIANLPIYVQEEETEDEVGRTRYSPLSNLNRNRHSSIWCRCESNSQL